MNNPSIAIANKLYVESLKAMDAEITALLSFAVDFKGEGSSDRLRRAQELIKEALQLDRGETP